MPAPISRSAYAAEFEILDRAIESDRGIQRLFPGDGSMRDPARGQAHQFLTRINKARAEDRMANSRIYLPDHPLHGQTAYASIIVRYPVWNEDKQSWVVTLERNDVTQMIVEDL